MDIKEIFGLLSAIILLIGGLPYLRDIWRKKIHPHILSWLGWSFITALGGSAMLAEGSRWVVALLFANTLSCIIVAATAIAKKVGVWKTSVYDGLFFALGITGLVLWQISDMPVIALIFAIVADFSFGVPTIIKTYKFPETEAYFSWATSTTSGLFSLFAVEKFNFAELAYPLYLFIFDVSVLLLVLKVIKRKK